MYISKKIEVSWTYEERQKIEDFRQFLQDTAMKVRDLLPSLYEALDAIDTSLCDVLYKPFDEEVEVVDTKEDE